MNESYAIARMKIARLVKIYLVAAIKRKIKVYLDYYAFSAETNKNKSLGNIMEHQMVLPKF